MTMQASPFAQIELGPPDPIFGLTEAFTNDTNPKKVNLAAGVYQDGAGKVPILHVVREAQERWQAKEENPNGIADQPRGPGFYGRDHPRNGQLS